MNKDATRVVDRVQGPLSKDIKKRNTHVHRYRDTQERNPMREPGIEPGTSRVYTKPRIGNLRRINIKTVARDF